MNSFLPVLPNPNLFQSGYKEYMCNRVTSSDVMNFSDGFSVSPHARALPGPQNTPLKFLCQT